jgi:hypothetical protein
LSIFLLFLFILGKHKTFMEKLFSENSKWRDNLDERYFSKWRTNLIGKMIFFKKIRDIIIEQPLNFLIHCSSSAIINLNQCCSAAT